MDSKLKCEIDGKLDYEGGFDYLVHGYDWAGQDEEFDLLVNNFKAATKDLEDFFGVLDCPEEDEDA